MPRRCINNNALLTSVHRVQLLEKIQARQVACFAADHPPNLPVPSEYEERVEEDLEPMEEEAAESEKWALPWHT